MSSSKTTILISSSPPRPQFKTIVMSSSPLPSPSELFSWKPTVLRAGINAAPIPQHATGFTTAANLYRKVSLDKEAIDSIRKFKVGTDIYDVPDDEDPEPVKKPRKNAAKKDAGEVKVAKGRKSIKEDNGDDNKKAQKPRIKKASGAIDGEEVKETASRKSKAMEDNGLENIVKEKAVLKSRAKKSEHGPDGTEPKEKIVRKPRAKKESVLQPKLSVTQITKTSDAKKSELVSKHFASAASSNAVDESMGYGLVEATKRRTDWTPPKPAKDKFEVTSLDTPDSVAMVNDFLDSAGSNNSVKPTGFNDLFGNFGFSNASTSVLGRQPSDGVGLNKRKLIELVKSNSSGSISTSPSPTKAKPTKKKARTITGLATSAFEEPVVEPAPILQYFTLKTTERVMTDGFKVPGKPRSKIPVKRPVKGGKTHTLLSPESALKQVSNQDFVFGTSSQLARETSPSLLRDLHSAMHASNEVDDDDPFASSPAVPESCVAAIGRPAAKRDLWSAASRNGVGSLLDVEMIDMTYSPIIPPVRRPIEQEVMPLTREGRITKDQSDFAEMDILPAPTQVGSANDTAVQADLNKGTSNSLNSPSEKKTTSPKRSKQTASPAKTTKASSSKPSSQANQAPDYSQMPDFEAFTDAQLAKQVASYHFKPVKKRAQMISLLETCWLSKQRTALDNLGTNTIIGSSPKKSPAKSQLINTKAPSSSQAISPKRPRGRPRKDSAPNSPTKVTKAKSKPKTTTRTVEYLEMDSDTPLSQIRTPQKRKKKASIAVDEISDSEAATTPSPPRLSQMRTPLRLGEEDLTIDTHELSPASAQAHLYKHITAAVTSTSPTKDPKNPTWHEKILLYDPIVLEDMTAWLNTGALEKVGWDGEVEPKEVKKWCESKSICCLWKENLRGGARARW